MREVHEGPNDEVAVPELWLGIERVDSAPLIDFDAGQILREVLLA
jgi:hypothetical protein